MNRHVVRLKARRRLDQLRAWAAALFTTMLMGLFLAQARAQESFSTSVGLGNAGYPISATPVVAAGTGTTGAVIAAIPAAPGRFSYLCSLHIDSTGSGSIGPITVTGLFGGTTFTFQATAGTPASLPVQTWSPCLPSNATNTAITVTTTADGTATAVDVNISGFQQ